jgi:hypothetical protein
MWRCRAVITSVATTPVGRIYPSLTAYDGPFSAKVLKVPDDREQPQAIELWRSDA